MPAPLALIASLIPLLTQAAPIVAGALGASRKTQEVVEGIAKAVTGKDTVETAVEAIRQDPNLALQFEMAVLQQKNELVELTFKDLADQRQKELDDREGARQRDVEVRKLTGGTNTRPNIMLVCVTLVLAYVIYEINTTDISTEVLAIYNMMIGAFLKMLGDAFAFEFGSSRGSKEKGEQLEHLLSRLKDRR